jgi:hypothetical protein
MTKIRTPEQLQQAVLLEGATSFLMKDEEIMSLTGEIMSLRNLLSVAQKKNEKLTNSQATLNAQRNAAVIERNRAVERTQKAEETLLRLGTDVRQNIDDAVKILRGVQ